MTMQTTPHRGADLASTLLEAIFHLTQWLLQRSRSAAHGISRNVIVCFAAPKLGHHRLGGRGDILLIAALVGMSSLR